MKPKIAANILETIGQTPLVALNRVPGPGAARVLAKVEAFNPGGSVKDRIALAMVEEAEQKGLIRPGDTLVEATSGNTGIGLAVVAAAKGYRLILTMPENMSVERQKLFAWLGAEIILTPAIEGMSGAVFAAEELAQKKGYYWLRQFTNPANPQIHRVTTAEEILAAVDTELDAFVAGVGTGGTITGVGEVLKKRVPGIQVIAVEPAKSAVLSGGRPGITRIQGLGAGFIPGVLNREIIDRVITVSDEEALDTARRLACEEGILAGLSSGAAAWAAVKVARELGPEKTVVTIFPDTGERYLSMIPLSQPRRCGK
ncbi:cysteine synthase A [Moorellaceae bacterium AZ2]